MHNGSRGSCCCKPGDDEEEVFWPDFATVPIENKQVNADGTATLCHPETGCGALVADNDSWQQYLGNFTVEKRRLTALVWSPAVALNLEGHSAQKL